MKKIVVLLAVVVFNLSLYACAAFSEARDVNDNAVTWTIYIEENSKSKKCVDEANSQLRKEGHANVISNASTPLNHGFWAVVFAYYEVNGSIRFRHGFGFSKVSKEDAEKDAVKNLAKYDTEWTKEKGYKLKESGAF